MSGERLFGTHIRPACKYCEHVLQAFEGGKLLCDKKGIVLVAYKCGSFMYNPLMRVPQKPKPLEKFEDSEFKIE